MVSWLITLILVFTVHTTSSTKFSTKSAFRIFSTNPILLLNQFQIVMRQIVSSRLQDRMISALRWVPRLTETHNQLASIILFSRKFFHSTEKWLGRDRKLWFFFQSHTRKRIDKLQKIKKITYKTDAHRRSCFEESQSMAVPVALEKPIWCWWFFFKMLITVVPIRVKQSLRPCWKL